MPFRLRDDARGAFFKKIRGKKPLSTDFDLFYLCLMLGLAGNRKSSSASRSTEFVDYFIGPYKGRARLLIGLTILAQLRNLGVTLHEKEEVTAQISKLIATDHSTSLSSAGMDIFNDYASGGYDILIERFPSAPHHAEEFLIRYAELLIETLQESGSWLREVAAVGDA